MGEQVGPVSAADLQNLAKHRTVSRDTFVRKGQDGAWVLAERVPGLFSVANATTPPLPATVATEERPSTKACLYCGEQILAVAIKCRYCGSDLIEEAKTQASLATGTAVNTVNMLHRPMNRNTVLLIGWVALFTLFMFFGLVLDFTNGTETGARLIATAVMVSTVYATLIVLGLVIYMWPTIEAKRRNHRQYQAILTLNLALGWTFLGWVVALVWARMAQEPPETPQEPRSTQHE